MLENVLIGIFTAIIVLGIIAVWWIENGPEKKDKNSDIPGNDRTDRGDN